jgi:hypothetical protein
MRKRRPWMYFSRIFLLWFGCNIKSAPYRTHWGLYSWAGARLTGHDLGIRYAIIYIDRPKSNNAGGGRESGNGIWRKDHQLGQFSNHIQAESGWIFLQILRGRGLGLHILKVTSMRSLVNFLFASVKPMWSLGMPVSPSFSYRQSKVSILLPVDIVHDTI